MNTVVYLGLGSNLGESTAILNSAIADLDEHSDLHVTARSSIYRSKPLDGMQQPDYYNMVIEAETSLAAVELLDLTQAVENRHGRQRDGERWQSRTLDIDILLYGHQIVKNARLLVPHPGITERDFVLYPLKELCPDLIIPLLGTVSDLVEQCPNRGLEPVGENS